jgi:MFS family permease
MSYVRISMSILMIPTAYYIGLWSDHAGSKGPLIVACIFGLLSIGMFAFLKETEEIVPNPQAAKTFSLSEQWSLVRSNRYLAIFLLATTLSGFANILAQPLFQIIQVNHLHLTFEQIGIARTVYFVALLLSFFLTGYLVDHFRPFYLIAIGILAFAIGPFAYGFSESFHSVLIGSIFQGIGDAIWDLGILAYVFRIAPGREAVVFGLHLMLFGIRGTIGPLLATSLTGIVPYSTMLVLAGTLALLGTFLFVYFNRKET